MFGLKKVIDAFKQQAVMNGKNKYNNFLFHNQLAIKYTYPKIVNFAHELTIEWVRKSQNR